MSTLVIAAGAVAGWEGGKWLLLRLLAERERRTDASRKRKLDVDRSLRLVRLQNLVRSALPADPALDSPYQRELREAAFDTLSGSDADWPQVIADKVS